MYNLTKMELFRLFKSKSTWIITVISVAFLLMAVIFTNTDLQMMKEESNGINNSAEISDSAEFEEKITEQGVTVDEDGVQMNMGIYFDTNYDWIDKDVNIAEYLITTLRSGVVLLFLTFFTAMFVNGENKHGFVKNIAGRMSFKGNLFLAKLPAIFVFEIMMFALYYVFLILFVKIIIGDIDLSVSKTAVKALLLQLVLHFAFACVVAMAAAVTRSTAFSATMGTAFCAGMGTLLWVFINMLVEKWNIAKDFIVNDYTLVYNIQQVGLSFDFKNTSRIIIVAVMFIAVSSIISVVTINKRDI